MVTSAVDRRGNISLHCRAISKEALMNLPTSIAFHDDRLGREISGSYVVENGIMTSLPTVAQKSVLSAEFALEKDQTVWRAYY